MECLDLTIVNNIHFWIGKSRLISGCFKFKINSEGDINQLLKTVLEINYLAIVKGVCYASFCRTNRQMFFHALVTFRKDILTIMALFERLMINLFISFFTLVQITSIGKIDLGTE